jgi:hypothetical protein
VRGQYRTKGEAKAKVCLYIWGIKMSAKRRTKIEIIRDMLEIVSKRGGGGCKEDGDRVWSESEL